MWRQPKTVWSVAFACVVAFMGIGLVDPILKPIAEELGASPSQVSLLFTSYMAVMGVAMLVTGVVSSRIGPKRTLLGGLAIIIVSAALAGETVRSHLVHLETTFDRDVIRRHVTVLVLTGTRLVIAHADDHADEAAGAAEQEVATATTESVPLSAVRGVMLTHVVADPQNYVPGSLGRELTLTLGWGAVARVDLLPATCGEPGCDADHGYEGSVASDDISLISSIISNTSSAPG